MTQGASPPLVGERPPTMRAKIRRALIPFAVAPALIALIAVLAVCVVLAFAAALDEAPGPSWAEASGNFGQILAMGLIYGLPGTYACALLLGVPAFLLVSWLGRESLASAIFAGACIAFLAHLLPVIFDAMTATRTGSFGSNGCMIVLDGVRTDCGWWRALRVAFIFAAIGALGGAIFWRLYDGRSAGRSPDAR